MPSGAELLAAGLREAGVEVVFGLPGVHNLPLWDALGDGPVRRVGVRHEQAAVYAADGLARAGGGVGVALVTTGPGAANTLGALGEAWASRSPVVVVATDVPSHLAGRGMSLHAGADQAAMARPVVKAVLDAGDAADLGALARAACATAAQAPARPVWLRVPADLLRAEAPPRDTVGPISPAHVTEPGPAAVEALARAERPLVWVGGGAVQDGADDAVAALAERLGAPVLTTFSGRGLLAGHPLAVGLPPHVPEAGALWDAADAVVAVGSDLDGMNTQDWRQPQPALLATVNVDPDDAHGGYAATHAVRAGATDGCRALVAALEAHAARSPWADLDDVRSRAWARLRAEFPDELRFLDAAGAALPREAVVLADMCIPGYWLAGFHRVPAPRRLQYPMGWGTLGFAFPASLGAAVAAAPGAPVVSFSGDGGFLFACGELATAAQERLPLTAVVVDDAAYGMLGTPLAGPDFALLAQSFDVHAEAVEGVGAAFADALARHAADPEPSLLHVRARLRPPPTTSPHWYRVRR